MRLAFMLVWTEAAAAADPAGPPCLSPITAADTPVAFRDVKMVPHDEPLPGRPAARQTVVSLSVCIVLSGQGTAALYDFSYTPVLYATDGHLLVVGAAYRRRIPSNDPMTGSLAILPTAADIGLGTVVDHAKLDDTVGFADIEITTCTEKGACSTPTPLGSRMEPACVADGAFPPPKQCPSAPERHGSAPDPVKDKSVKPL